MAAAVTLGCQAAVSRADGGGDRSIRLMLPDVHVLDGDTFEADLNGNGRLEPPAERVRLLYVDAPELHDSPKGKDVAHGVPAKAALEALLRVTPIDLQIFAVNAHDAYGLTLARVLAGGVDVSLELIRLGHSPFDTRFTAPSDYDAFAKAEAEAFEARRGIWGDGPSRKRYLERLRSEGTTPRSRKNSWYVPGILPTEVSAIGKQVGRYVTVAGTLTGLRQIRSGAVLARLRQGPAPALAVFAKPSVAARLGLAAWAVGSVIQAEGFVQKYKGNVELALHHAQRK